MLVPAPWARAGVSAADHGLAPACSESGCRPPADSAASGWLERAARTSRPRRRRASAVSRHPRRARAGARPPPRAPRSSPRGRPLGAVAARRAGPRAAGPAGRVASRPRARRSLRARPARREPSAAARSLATTPLSSPTAPSTLRWPWRMLSSSRSERSRAARSDSSPRWISRARRSSSVEPRLEALLGAARGRELGGGGLLGLGQLALRRARAAGPAPARRCSLALRRRPSRSISRRLSRSRSMQRSSASTRSCCSAYSRCLARRSSCSTDGRVRGSAAACSASIELGHAPLLLLGLAQALLEARHVGLERAHGRLGRLRAADQRGVAGLHRAARAAFGQQVALGPAAAPPSPRRTAAGVSLPLPSRCSYGAPDGLGTRPSAARITRAASRAPLARCRADEPLAIACAAACRASRPATDTDGARVRMLPRHSLCSRQAIRDCSDHSSMKPGEAACENSPPDCANDARLAS